MSCRSQESGVRPVFVSATSSASSIFRRVGVMFLSLREIEAATKR